MCIILQENQEGKTEKATIFFVSKKFTAVPAASKEIESQEPISDEYETKTVG